MNVPVRPTPALQCTISLLPDIMQSMAISSILWTIGNASSCGASWSPQPFHLINHVFTWYWMISLYSLLLFLVNLSFLSTKWSIISCFARNLISCSARSSRWSGSVSSGQYLAHWAPLASCRLHSIMITLMFCWSTIRQKCSVVVERGPCVAIIDSPGSSVWVSLVFYSNMACVYVVLEWVGPAKMNPGVLI